MPVTATHDDPTDDARRWTEPGASRWRPGVHRIPLPLPMDGLRAVNVYVLETDDSPSQYNSLSSSLINLLN